MADTPYEGIEDVEVRNHSSRVIPLWVNGRPAYKLAISPSELDFGNGTVGITSQPMAIELTNRGFQHIDMQGISITGAEFKIISDLPTRLRIDESVLIQVVFTPITFSESVGTLHVDVGGGITYDIPLKGNGVWNHVAVVDRMLSGLWGFIQRSVQPALVDVGPQLSLSNTSLLFRDQVEVGQQSPIMTVVITNPGNRDLVLGDLLITGDFEIVT